MLGQAATSRKMKPLRNTNLLLVVMSVLDMLLCGCGTPGNTASTHDDAFFKLHDEVKTFLSLAKDNLARGEDFKICVNGGDVSAGVWSNPYTGGNQANQRMYWLDCRARPLYEGLTGWLTIHRVDTTHVNVVFRQGGLQLNLSPIAICIDNYDLGNIEWDTSDRKQGQTGKNENRIEDNQAE